MNFGIEIAEYWNNTKYFWYDILCRWHERMLNPEISIIKPKYENMLYFTYYNGNLLQATKFQI